jgi:hypothetical protein
MPRGGASRRKNKKFSPKIFLIFPDLLGCRARGIQLFVVTTIVVWDAAQRAIKDSKKSAFLEQSGLIDRCVVVNRYHDNRSVG